jgi:enoyl-[acyl-carrier protein] reductase I
MAFLRTLVLACVVAHCAAFNPSVGTLGRFGSLKKSVSYTQTKAAPLRTAPKASSRRAAASDISMGYNIDLTGKVAFIGGVADSSGYGWAIAKQLANAGATIIVGTWPPVLSLFERGIKKGFGEDSKLIDGSDMKIAKVYPLDAMFTDPSEIPDDIKNNKRYAGLENYDIKSCAEQVKKDFGKVDILVHSLANGPEVTRPLLDTTRNGYLAASSASAYSMVAMLSAFGEIMPEGSSAVSLTYLASEKVVPGYGGGMSSAKAQLESDTKVLAWEAGRKYGIRVNCISAGPLASRAAIAIKKGAPGERNYIDYCIDYNMANSPLPKPLFADDVGRAALALCSELNGAVTGTCQYVDNGMHAMGLSIDSTNFVEYLAGQSGDPWDYWKPDVYKSKI